MNSFQNSYHRGFSAVMLLVIVAVIAVAGALGYVAYGAFFDTKTTEPTSVVTQSATQQPTVKAITTDADLAEIGATLDTTEIDTFITLEELDQVLGE